MNRIFVPTAGASDWSRLVAKLEHWKKGASAMSLAASWEGSAPRFPLEVSKALSSSATDNLAGLSIVVAMPEFKVKLPGGSRASQTDLMVLARNDRGTVTIAVEGKVEEAFGPTIAEKKRDASDGQGERLAFLERTLGLSGPCDDAIRYQLLHRAASALLFAQEVHARAAVLLVHSFSKTGSWFDDFDAFAKALGATATKDSIVRAGVKTAVPLYLGWVKGNEQFLEVDIPAIR